MVFSAIAGNYLTSTSLFFRRSTPQRNKIFNVSQRSMAVSVRGPYDIKKRKGYTVCYSYPLRQPLYVHETLTPWSIRGKTIRCNKFEEDREIPARVRATLSDYRDSGFDRGHMSPDANQGSSRVKTKETYLSSNICPQVGIRFNQGKWGELEEYVRSIVEKSLSVDVISGPLFLPVDNEVRYSVIGPNNIPVPTHFFKMILASYSNGNLEEEAYILPNGEIQCEEELSSFARTIEEVERLSGVLVNE